MPGKKILEVGSGTSLPGIVAAKCGAIVTLTDDPTIPGTIKHVQKCCYMNGLYPEQVNVFTIDNISDFFHIKIIFFFFIYLD